MHLLIILKGLLVYTVYKIGGECSTKFVQIRGDIHVRCKHYLGSKDLFDKLCVVYGTNEVSYKMVTK